MENKEVNNKQKEERGKVFSLIDGNLAVGGEGSAVIDENLLILDRLMDLFQKLDLPLEMSFLSNLINDWPTLNIIVENVIEKNINKVRAGNLESISSNWRTRVLLEAYCELHGIEGYDVDQAPAYDYLLSAPHDIMAQTLPALEKSEVNALIKQYLEGNKKAGEKLIRSHLTLVDHIAGRYQGRGHDYEDLIQNGCVGLLKAIEKFDFEREKSLTTIAYIEIKHEVVRQLNKNGKLTKIPDGTNDIIKKIKKYKEVISQIQEEMDRMPSIQEIANRLQMTTKEVGQLQFLSTNFLSINEQAYLSTKDQEDCELGDLICNEEISMEEEVIRNVMQKEVQQLFQACELSEYQRNILNLRFGLDGNPIFTQRKLAEKYNVSQASIYQNEKKALNKLRRMKNVACFANYMDNPDASLEFLKNSRYQGIKDKAKVKTK